MGAALLALGLLGAWQLYADLGPVQSFLLPSPSDVASTLFSDRSLLWANFTVTAEEIVIGIALAVIAALALVAAMHAFASVRRAVYPLVIASQTVPVPVIAPLLIVWLGFDLTPKLAIVALVCFFPIVVSTLDGLAAVDPELRKLMRSFDAGRWRTLALVEAPSALPALFSGLKIAVVVAPIGAVFAEFAGSSNGLGHLIEQASSQFQTARGYAAVVALSLFAILLFYALSVAERRLLPWAGGSRRRLT